MSSIHPLAPFAMAPWLFFISAFRMLQLPPAISALVGASLVASVMLRCSPREAAA